jgi:hypothetical protein
MLKKVIIQETRPDPNRLLLVLLVLAVCVFLLGMATKAEVENVKKETGPASTAIGGGKAFEAEEATLIKPEEEPALYKTQINPVTPKTGIETGHVIAYGHYIKPPYKLEVREDTLLFLNGIRICPTLPSRVAEEYSKRLGEKALEKLSKEDLAIYKKHEVLFEEVKNVYKKVNAQKGREQALDSVFKLIAKDTLLKVVDTTLGQTGGVVLGIDQYLPGISESWGSSVDLGYSYKREAQAKLSPYFKKRIRERAKNEKDRLEKDLKENKTVICTSFNQAINTYKESDFWEILRILKSEELSLNEKLEKLFSIAAVVNGKELIYNFEPTEWPLNKKIEG